MFSSSRFSSGLVHSYLSPMLPDLYINMAQFKVSKYIYFLQVNEGKKLTPKYVSLQQSTCTQTLNNFELADNGKTGYGVIL